MLLVLSNITVYAFPEHLPVYLNFIKIMVIAGLLTSPQLMYNWIKMVVIIRKIRGGFIMKSTDLYITKRG